MPERSDVDLHLEQAGYEILKDGGSALDACESAVKVMEDCPLFNAGKGAVFTHNGYVEMDASVMDGSTGQAGGAPIEFYNYS